MQARQRLSDMVIWVFHCVYWAVAAQATELVRLEYGSHPTTL